MPKTKRNSTWYRHLHKEQDQTLHNIFGFVSHNPIEDQLDSDSDRIIEKECIVDSTQPGNCSSSLGDYDDCFGSSNDVINKLNIDNDLRVNNQSNDTEHTSTNKLVVGTKLSSTLDKLRDWAVSHKINLCALNDLLGILAKVEDGDFKKIPKDSRTFLSTPKTTFTRKVAPGEYHHFGIQNSIEQMYKNCNEIPSNDEINIGINIDGLPLSKSSSSQLYPILGINRMMKVEHVFLIGIYHGYEKPRDFNDFLSEFVDEAQKLTNSGVVICKRVYAFKISMFLFDAVAKASVLYIKGHSGYESCSKCTQEGEYVRDRICFPELSFTKRTHLDFVAQTHPDHHTGYCTLLNIPNVDIIKDVPLDYMHLVMLGVVKKLLCGTWVHGPPPHKFSGSQVAHISEELQKLAAYVPSEFARRPRSLKEVKRWKATEYRQFLLYTGPIVLKKYLSKQKYQHFLTLSAAITFLLSNKNCHTYSDYAASLLLFFVKTVKKIYGVQMITHNFHNLLHLAEDVKQHGSLENFSNFSSENFLQSLKRLMRKHEKPLQQVVCRYSEIIKNKFVPPLKDSSYMTLINPHSNNFLIEGCTAPEYKTVLLQDYKLSCNRRDCCCFFKDGSVVEIKNIAFSPKHNQVVVIGQRYEVKTDLFTIPCSSSLLNIYMVQNLGILSSWPVSEIICKFARFPFNDSFAVIPIIHSLHN